MLDVRFFHSGKIVNLAPRHQLGWIWTLLEAKQQDREGLFPSLAALRLAANTFRDCVPVWIDAGLLHYAEKACQKDIKTFGDIPAGALIVHDWHEYQPSRTSIWRGENAVASGHVNKAVGETPESIGETNGETSGKHSLARARASRGSRSLSSSVETTEGVQGEPDPWEAFRARTGQIPGKKLGGWLNDLSAKYGDTAVSGAIAETPLAGRIPPDYLRAIEDGLAIAARKAERAEREDEVARNAAKRAPVRSIEQREADYRAEQALQAEILRGGVA